MDTMGNSQQQVLQQLLERRLGATVDELGASIGLSRTAINQHLLSLEHGGYVRRGVPRRTAGRPQQVYVLTEEGARQFPKQYAWFSRLLIQTLRQDMGEEKTSVFMYNLGVKRSAQLTPRLIGKGHGESVDEVVKIMNETGFVARVVAPAGPGSTAVVECKNCVYHDVSKDYPEVCRFDVGLLSGLLGSEVQHESCMHRSSESCRFRIAPPASGSETS
jgi:DeoR family suf operon transcriptional repressor